MKTTYEVFALAGGKVAISKRVFDDNGVVLENQSVVRAIDEYYAALAPLFEETPEKPRVARAFQLRPENGQLKFVDVPIEREPKEFKLSSFLGPRGYYKVVVDNYSSDHLRLGPDIEFVKAPKDEMEKETRSMKNFDSENDAPSINPRLFVTRLSRGKEVAINLRHVSFAKPGDKDHKDKSHMTEVTMMNGLTVWIDERFDIFLDCWTNAATD